MRRGIILLYVLLLTSCKHEDELGICNGYDENGTFVTCLSDKTGIECAKLDSDQHNGYRWEFIKGADICGPPFPGD